MRKKIRLLRKRFLIVRLIRNIISLNSISQIDMRKCFPTDYLKIRWEHSQALSNFGNFKAVPDCRERVNASPGKNTTSISSSRERKSSTVYSSPYNSSTLNARRDRTNLSQGNLSRKEILNSYKNM